MIAPAALIAALPPAARPYIAAGLDPAAAWIALHDGLTVAQARSRARNERRAFGTSWPDRLPAAALADAPSLENLPGASDPLEMRLAVDAALAALAAPGAAAALRAADLDDMDTAAHAAACRITRRRAQQLRRERVNLSERQMPLFDDADDEEGEQ